MNRRRFLAATGSGAAFASAGCIGQFTGGDETVEIGAVFLLSGVGEVLGQGSVASARVGVDAVNDDGGILDMDVELTELDNEGDTNRASRLFQDLVEDGADAIIGLTSSGVALGSASTIEQLGVPYILTDIGTPYLTEHDYDTYGSHYEDENNYAAGVDNLFRTNANTSPNTYAMARFATEELDGIQRVANIGPDYAYGHQCWEYFQAYCEGLGADFEFVAEEWPSLGAGDMTPQINTVMDAEPDLVFTSFWGGDVTTFVSQAAEQGLFDEVVDVFDTLGASPGNFDQLSDVIPRGIHFSGWYWHSAYDNEANQAYLDRYRETYQDDDSVYDIPPMTGASTYTAIWYIKQAMEEAGSTDYDDVVEAMKGQAFEDDPRGPTEFSDHQQATASTVIGEVSDDDDVPYDGPGLDPSYTYTLDRDEALDLLDGSGLSPGV